MNDVCDMRGRGRKNVAPHHRHSGVRHFARHSPQEVSANGQVRTQRMNSALLSHEVALADNRNFGLEIETNYIAYRAVNVYRKWIKRMRNMTCIPEAPGPAVIRMRNTTYVPGVPEAYEAPGPAVILSWLESHNHSYARISSPTLSPDSAPLSAEQLDVDISLRVELLLPRGLHSVTTRRGPLGGRAWGRPRSNRLSLVWKLSRMQEFR